MRGNFCKEKNGNIIVGKLNKYQNYLPITFIYKIIFSNNDIKERFKQMEYTNTFDLEDYQLEINNRFHLNSTSEDCLEKDPDRGDNFKLKIYEFEKFDPKEEDSCLESLRKELAKVPYYNLQEHVNFRKDTFRHLIEFVREYDKDVDKNDKILPLNIVNPDQQTVHHHQ